MERVVSDDPRHTAPRPTARRSLDRLDRLPRIRHRDGPDHPANAQQSAADFPAMIWRDDPMKNEECRTLKVEVFVRRRLTSLRYLPAGENSGSGWRWKASVMEFCNCWTSS